MSEIVVNGRAVPLEAAPPQQTLQDFVRDVAGEQGTVGACGHGVCGACTVLLSDRPVRSCLTLSSAAAGRSVVTVEGLEGEVAERLRQAFLEHNAFQCGYCTAGWLVLATWWLTAPPEERSACQDVSALLATNLCRCTGYDGLRKAIEHVDHDLKGMTA
jgi:carbon-monoxide dehydrogenase small subunit